MITWKVISLIGNVVEEAKAMQCDRFMQELRSPVWEDAGTNNWV